MSTILVPYHLDEHLSDLRAALPAGADATTVTEEFPEGDIWTRLGGLHESVAGAVEKAARAGSAPTVLSGDCTVSLGVMAGLQHAGVDASVVWFDAHGDVQTLETTTSGYIGGMPTLAGPLQRRPARPRPGVAVVRYLLRCRRDSVG